MLLEPQSGPQGRVCTPPLVGSLGRGSGGGGGGGEHTVGKSGLTSRFFESRDWFELARVPDVLSKAPSLGRPWDRLPFKVNLAPSFACCTWGGLAPCLGTLHNPS